MEDEPNGRSILTPTMQVIARLFEDFKKPTVVETQSVDAWLAYIR
jgi:hypothetical protein